MIAFAESCTGGLLAARFTELAGASKAFWGGVVSYTEASKVALLGVNPDTIATQGVVSRATVEEMALGLLSRSGADYSIAISGFAGPDAPEAEGRPGRVCIAWGRSRPGDDDHASVKSVEYRFQGGRAEIRAAACERAFGEALAFCVERDA
jgi:PncC family amidohydrolase